MLPTCRASVEASIRATLLPVRAAAEEVPMSDRVAVSISHGVADVRLNRPDKLNALDQAMFSALVEVGESLKSDRSVRAVVLSGEGRGFCAGLDFGSFMAMAGDSEPSNATGERPAVDFEAERTSIANRGQMA